MRSKRWSGFRAVLCPVDFSDPSAVALRYAASVATRARGALVVQYAIDPLLATAAATRLHDRGLATRSARELRRFIDASLGRAALRHLRLKTQVVAGHAASEILESARKVDLIVMGTHGLSGARRLLLGSTTLSVLQRTTVPVLAVPESVGETRMRLSPWPAGRIVAAVELDGEARQDVATSASVAEWFGASLLLLHVVAEISAPAWLRGLLTPHDQTRVAHAQRVLDALVPVARRRLDIETRVICGSPADEIAASVAIEKSDLLLTALRDRQAWFGAKRGSVSYQVLTHAVVPVLALPRPWRPR
jgi:nucleotide-binding universal stress UspA family protein